MTGGGEGGPMNDEKPDGPPEQSTYALWIGGESRSEPLTMESIQAAWDSIVKNSGHRPPMRVVSHEVYKRAEDAIAEGASYLEVEYILAGASRELAKEMAGVR